MTRKLRSEAAAQTAAASTAAVTDDRSSVGGVVGVTVDSRLVVTVEPSAEVWVGGGIDAQVARDAIVRLIPPADATDVLIATVRGAFETAGAAAVRVVPRVAGGAVVPRAAMTPAASAAPVREVVMQMVNEARVDDAEREQLRAVVDEALTAEGL